MYFMTGPQFSTITSMTMYIRKRKPIKCPHCGTHSVARIVYGMPFQDPALSLDIENFEYVVLGGCCIEINAPAWQSTTCDTPLYRESDLEEE